MMDAALDAIIGANGQGIITSWNRAATEMFGYAEINALGMPLTAIVPESFWAAHSKGLARFAATNEGRLGGQPARLVGRRSDGSEFPMELSLGVSRDRDEMLFSAVIRDCTESEWSIARAREAEAELRAGQRELRRSNTLLRTIVDGIPDAVYLKDRQSRFTLVNAACVRLLGIPADEIVGRTIEELFPTPAGQQARREDDVVVATAAVQQFELNGLLGGTNRVMATTKRPLLGSDGEVVGVIGISRDVTRERSLEDERAGRLSAELRESQLRTLADAIPQIVWTAEPDGDLDYYNRHWFEYTGMSLEETRGWGWEPVLHPDDRAECVRRWTAAFTTGDPYEVEYRFKRASDGAYRWHLGRACPVRDTSGNIVKWFGTCTDIHDQRMAVESLRRWELVFQHSAFGVVLIDAEQTHVVTANPAFARMHGYQAGELDGKPLSHIHGLYDDAANTRLVERIASTEHLVFETVHRRKDGSQFPLRVSIIAVPDANGAITYRVGHCEDLTQASHAEAARKLAEDTFRAVQDVSPDAFMMWDVVRNDAGELVDGVLHYLNASASRLLGAAGPFAVGQGMHALFPGLRDSGRLALYREAYDTGIPVEIEVRHETLRRWLRLVVMRVGDRLGFVSSDVTEAREAEMVLRRSKDDLERLVAERTMALSEQTAELARSNEELEHFAHVASHDLQEPLRMVSSYTQLLASGYSAVLDDEGREYMAFAVEGADRMRQLIKDLLAYSRVGSRDMARSMVDCAGIVQTVMRDLGIAIQESGARITVGALPAVLGDAPLVKQLFQNLIANAIKFRGETQPHVAIAAVPDGHCWGFTVVDNGIGIAPEYHERIFDVFSRLHTREEYPGTGIGLSLCKRIVERHGGQIRVQSQVGRGSSFTFSLPAHIGSREGTQ